MMSPSSSTLGREPHRSAESGRPTPRNNKACVPCRARKARCDSPIVGHPCSNCRSRNCVDDCVPVARKGRTRKGVHAPSTPRSQTTGSPATSDRQHSEDQSRRRSTSNKLDSQGLGQTEPDLLYLQILNDAVDETPDFRQSQPSSTTPYRPRLEERIIPRNSQSTRLSQLDDADREYLTKKGVFDLPPVQHLDALIKAYFAHVHPFVPVINRADFIPRYQSGDCSLLLLRVMLTTACLHAPADVIAACGFTNRSAAQESFFTRARILYDTAPEEPLVMLQASIILCLVLLDHTSDRDFGYWLHNAIGLATKLNLRDIVIERTKPREVLKLYRRIWWALYSLDVFHLFINTRRYRLLEDSTAIEPLSEDDWEDIDVPSGSSDLLSPVTSQRKASRVALCGLSRLFAQCLSTVKTNPPQDPRQIMAPVDTWRKTLASKMHVDADSCGTNISYLSVQAMSYRFECILCRLIQRTWKQDRSTHTDWLDWAKQRLRTAILELDTIVVRVLASDKLEECIMPFVTTITALLALHIESALDPAATPFVRSMACVSISQTMLVLTQGREIPALKRALPIFEEILSRNGLYLVPRNSLGVQEQQQQVLGQVEMGDGTGTDEAVVGAGGIAENTAYASLHTPSSGVWPQLDAWENGNGAGALQGDLDFMGFDFLDGWQQVGGMDFVS